ncbi:MAG TPA: RNA-binding protein [Thermoanaerobaculia bacterium]|nr:RNA-binding protein [Thermoanaerobaculia bacterium]
MGKKLFVGNLSFNSTSEDLKNCFAAVGNCLSATVMTDRETGRSRGFAFVEMGTDEEAARAVTDLNGQDFQGRKLNVSEARERGERPPGGFAPRPSPRPGGGGGGYQGGGGGGGYQGGGGGGGYEGGGGGGYGGGGDYPVNAPVRKEKGSRRGLRGKKRSL